MIPLLCATTAHAGDWNAKPYVAPIIDLSLVTVDHVSSAQASAGAEAGVRARFQDSPHWLSTTRTQVVGTYGLPSGSLGGDLRLGSFFGPDGKLVGVQVGPDLWYQGYGRQDSTDYWLPWTPGLDLRGVATLKIVDELHLVGEASPGWVFDAERRSDLVKPFDQLTLAAMLVVRAPFMRLTLGYSQQYTSAGKIEGLILSGAI